MTRPHHAGRVSARLGRVAIGAGVLTLVASVGAAVALVRGSDDDPRCSTESEGTVTLHGMARPLETSRWDAGTVLDAHEAQWRGREPYVVVLDGAPALCVSGGTITGTWPPSTSWDVMHGTGSVILGGARPVLEDVSISGYGDAVRLVDRAQGFELRRVQLRDIRDDCVEDDWLHSGIVRDSLLDGCYNAFSARTYDGQRGVSDGSHNVFTVEDSLVRLQPMQRTYHDEGPVPGTAGFFKWDPRGPRLELHGNVFRADQPAGTVGLGLPPGKLAGCSDNVMVWLGKGPYPAPLPDCFELTRDVQVWDRAVSDWRAAHLR